MGAINSRPLSSRTKEEVESHVRSLGSDFEAYAALVDDNGIDGDLLSEMDEAMFLETLDDIDITQEAHRTRLLEDFRIYASCHATGSVGTSTTAGGGPISEIVVMGNISTKSILSTSLRRHISLDLTNTSSDQEHQQQAHLAPDFFQKVDRHPEASRPPIAQDDMNRTAELETYRLDEIEPDSGIAEKLKGLVEMAMKMFHVDLGDITFLTNEYQFSLARVGLTKPMEEAIMGDIYEAINYTSSGQAFTCRTDRSIGICNYPHYSKKSFTVHDIEKDDSFKWMRHTWPFRCYMGAPLLSASGVVIGTLCLHNLEPRPDFDSASEAQLEQVAGMIVQSIENWRLQRNITKLETTRQNLDCNKDKSNPPKEKPVLVFAGVEEYDTLKVLAPGPSAEALKEYQSITKSLLGVYFGFEVSRIGEDGYYLAFHDAVDAFGFALDLQQQLFDAEWSQDLLKLPRVCDNESGFRGLRIKMSVYMGDVTATENPETGKVEYQSPKCNTVGIAQNLFNIAYGGQILTTFDTWNVASFMAESKLEYPQVVDLGSHVIRKGKHTNEGVISQRIVQLVPESLAMNYAEKGDCGEDMDFSYDGLNDNGLWGRQFPDIKTLNKLSPSFFDAPGFNAKKDSTTVTIAFIGTSEIEKRYKEAATIVSQVIGLVSSALRGTKGYQCQNNMLAFPNITSAVQFGLDFSDLLEKQIPLSDNVNLCKLVTYGCVDDTFITLEPHKTTGRADYFGKVVNRAARVAYTSELGTVCAGVTVTPEFNKDDFTIKDKTIRVQFRGARKLKGVDGEMAVFECTRS